MSRPLPSAPEPDPRTLSGLLQLVRAVPEVRAERVATLRAAIQAGTYHVDPYLVADRLIAAHMRPRRAF